MRRAAVLIAVILILVSLPATALAARPATSFVVRASHAEQGGVMHLRAKVKHARRWSTFSATAVVHFASGDVTLDLRRRGWSFVARGRVRVAADETPGAVPVDVTFWFNGTPEVVTAEGYVDDDVDEPPDEDPPPPEI